MEFDFEMQFSDFFAEEMREEGSFANPSYAWNEALLKRSVLAYGTWKYQNHECYFSCFGRMFRIAMVKVIVANIMALIISWQKCTSFQNITHKGEIYAREFPSNTATTVV